MVDYMAGCTCENWTLQDLSSALQDMHKDNKRIVVPMFQRGKRWSKKQEQIFIDSLIKGYPVGTMLFYETFEDNINYQNETTHKDYYLSTSIKYKDIVLSAFKYIETKKKKTTIFRYISDLEIKDSNIKEIVSMGRKRWKIENEGFYTQKHRTFNISHLNSRNDTAMKNHYFFIQFAHTIRQLLEQGNLLTKSLKLKIKEVSHILLNTLTSKTSDLNNLENKFQLRFDD